MSFILQYIFSMIIIINISGEQCHTTRDSLDQGGKYAACALPFKFNGKLNDVCITDGDPEGKYWCSTKINPRTKEHVGGEGNWGHCSDNCISKILEERT